MTKTTETNRNNNRVILLFWLIFTTVWIFASINPIKLLFTWNRETWTVVNVEVNEEEDDDWGTYYTYTPIVKYKCWWNVITESARSSSSFKYKRWESINIICDPLNYWNFILYSDFLILLFPIIWLFVLFLYFNSIKWWQTQMGKENTITWNSLLASESIKLSNTAPQNSSSEIIIPKNRHWNNNIQSTSNIPLFFGLFIFWWVSLFLVINLCSWRTSGNILWEIFCTLCSLWATVLIWYGSFKNIQNSNRIKNAKNNIEKWLLTQKNSIVKGFRQSATVLDQTYYEIITTDWNVNFYSERIPWKVIWFNDDISRFLDAEHIIYDPRDPQKALNELHQISNRELLWKYQWVDKILNNVISIKSPKLPDKNILWNYMQVLYTKTEQWLKNQIEQWESYKQPYWIFNGKKIYVWDIIKVYIDPFNEKIYLVDLSILN